METQNMPDHEASYIWWNNIIQMLSSSSEKDEFEQPEMPSFQLSFKIIQSISPLLTLFFKDLRENTYCFLNDFPNYSQDSDDSDDLDIPISRTPQLNYSPNHSNSEFQANLLWERIYMILKQLNNDNDISDPTIDFPGFIDIFYSSKQKINPLSSFRKRNDITFQTCITDIIKLISLNSKAHDPEFILWDLPSALEDDEFIYFMVLFELQSSYHLIWKKFASTFGAINLFFDHYLPLLGPSNDSTTHILIRIFDLIFHQEQSYFNITKPKKQAKILYLKYMRIIGCSTNPEIITSAFLAAKSLYLQMIPDLPSTYQFDWLNMLIDASSNGVENGYLTYYKIEPTPKKVENTLLSNDYRVNPVHYSALDFLFSLNVPKFKYMTLCKTLAKQGITSTKDLYYIHLCLMQNIKKPLYGIKFLLTTASSNKIFSTTATKLLVEPLMKFSKLTTVRQCVSLFVRKGFAFIGVTMINNKYARRRLMILQMFRTLYSEATIDWLSEVIIKYYSSLVNSGRMNHLAPDIPLFYKNEKKLKKITSKMDLYQNNKMKGHMFSSPSIEATRSVSDFNQAIEETANDNSEEKPYDKMFITELDRILKIQTNLKNYLNQSNIDSISPKNPISIRTTNSQYHTKKPMNQPVINARQQRIQQVRERYLKQHQENLEQYRNFHGIKRPPFDTSTAKQEKQPGKPSSQSEQHQIKVKRPPLMVMRPSPRQMANKRKAANQNKPNESDSNPVQFNENDIDELICRSVDDNHSIEDKIIPESTSIDFQQFNIEEMDDDGDEEDGNEVIVNQDVEMVENDDNDEVNSEANIADIQEDDFDKNAFVHQQPQRHQNILHDVKKSPPTKNLVVPKLKQIPMGGAKSACRPLFHFHPSQPKKTNIIYKPVKL